MLTYNTVAAGMPSHAGGGAPHHLDQTVPKEVSDLARYYGGTGSDGVEIRADIHPLAAEGLGLDKARPVSREEMSAILAGRRADGKKIDGKRQAGTRECTDAKTGE